MKTKKLIIFPLLVTLLVSTVACGGGGKEQATPTPTPIATSTPTPGLTPTPALTPTAVPGLTPQEIAANAVSSSESQQTAKFELSVKMDMIGQIAGESGRVKMALDANGSMDFPNEKLKMIMTLDMDAAGEKMEMDMETYLVSRIMYIKVSGSGIPEQWMKMKVPAAEFAEFWESEDLIRQQMAMLETSQVELLDTETAEGIDCYVLSIVPELDDLWDIMVSQQGLQELFTQKPANITDVIKSYSVKQWLAKDTYFLVKADIEMTLALTSQYMSMPGVPGDFDLTADYEISMLLYDYNEPVSITLPSGAEGAIEVPWQGF